MITKSIALESTIEDFSIQLVEFKFNHRILKKNIEMLQSKIDDNKISANKRFLYRKILAKFLEKQLILDNTILSYENNIEHFSAIFKSLKK